MNHVPGAGAGSAAGLPSAAAAPGPRTPSCSPMSTRVSRLLRLRGAGRGPGGRSETSTVSMACPARAVAGSQISRAAAVRGASRRSSPKPARCPLHTAHTCF